MTLNILFAATPQRWDDYEQPLQDALDKAGIDAYLAQDIPPEQVDYPDQGGAEPLGRG